MPTRCEHYYIIAILVRVRIVTNMKQPTLVSELKAIGQLTTFRKNAHLAFQGEVPRYAHYVVDGVVKAYTITPDGVQRLVNIYAKHSIVPIAWLGGEASTALFYYQAMADTRAIRFTRRDFADAIENNHDMAREFIAFMSKAHTTLLLRTTGMCQTSASHKICYALYILSMRYGIERDDNHFLIPIPLTHETIGNFIGQSRENTAKTIKQLSEQGVLSYASKQYTINRDKLERYIGEDSFRTAIS